MTTWDILLLALRGISTGLGIAKIIQSTGINKKQIIQMFEYVQHQLFFITHHGDYRLRQGIV